MAHLELVDFLDEVYYQEAGVAGYSLFKAFQQTQGSVREFRCQLSVNNDLQSIKTVLFDGTIDYRHPETNELHREEGPAVEYPDGSKVWYLNGQPHRGSFFRKTTITSPTMAARNKYQYLVMINLAFFRKFLNLSFFVIS